MRQRGGEQQRREGREEIREPFLESPPPKNPGPNPILLCALRVFVVKISGPREVAVFLPLSPLTMSPRVRLMKKTVLSSCLRGAVALGLFIGAGLLHADEPTALQLVEEGNRHVGIDAKDRVVQIRSEKSIGSLIPAIWYVVYYDPDAPGKATEVKFGAGKKLGVKRPSRVFNDYKELDREKIKVDSDKAIRIATAEPLLKNLNLTATQLWLERWGPEQIPVWKVRIWATKLRRPEKAVDVGNVYVATEDGTVVKNDLAISRVD